MSNFLRILNELSKPGDPLTPETSQSAKNKLDKKVNLDPCLCGKNGKGCGSDNCRCKKKKFNEGQTKRKLESKIEKMCTCDGGASLDPADHDKDCPAYDKLQDGDYGSDDIDAAEYQYGDR